MIKTASTEDLERVARSLFAGIRNEFVFKLDQAREDMARVVQANSGAMGVVQGHSTVALKRHKELSDRIDAQVYDAQRDRDMINALDDRLILVEKQISEIHSAVGILRQQLTAKMDDLLKAFAKLENTQ